MLVGAIILLFVLSLMHALTIPLAAIVLGFFVLGYAFPELLEGLTPYGKTVWLPIAFVVAAAIAMYFVFTSHTFAVIMGAPWCGSPPCVPLGLIILAFVLGSLGKLFTLRMKGEKVDWFGESIRD